MGDPSSSMPMLCPKVFKNDEEKLIKILPVGMPFLPRSVYKAEKMEPGRHHTVCAARGVSNGTWYFEIKVEDPIIIAGWVNENADLTAPIGYDMHGFGYRDIDGGKVNQGYVHRYDEDTNYGPGDIFGIYIHLPRGDVHEPWPPSIVACEGKTHLLVDPRKEVVPGSEICYYKNGVCQGSAFQNITGGRYYPAATTYQHPNQPNCEIVINFGPKFDFFPQDFGGRPIPLPMNELPDRWYKPENSGPAENGLCAPYKVILSSNLSQLAFRIRFLKDQNSSKQRRTVRAMSVRRTKCKALLLLTFITT